MMCNPIYYQTRFDLEREIEERKEAQSKKKSDETCRKNRAKRKRKKSK